MRITPPELLAKAKNLRRTQTPWEAKLWYHLRGKRFLGYKFKRQVRIDNYIVDFCCREKMLIIELDGGQHNEELALFQDLKRQKYLENLGYKLIRFWNSELDENMDGVLETIKERLESSSNLSPDPSPIQERGVLNP